MNQNNYEQTLESPFIGPIDMNLDDSVNDHDEVSRYGSAKEWLRNHRLSLALGATAASLAAGVALNPIGETIDKIKNEAAWVIPTAIGMDVAIGVGACMMIAATSGDIVKNPFKAKAAIKDIPKKANNSRLFKAGFASATAGGVGFGLVTTGAVFAYLPPEAWGAAALPALDLAGTVYLRKEIWKGIKESAQRLEEQTS